MELTKRRSISLKIFSFCLACAIIVSTLAEASIVFARTNLTIHPITVPVDPNQPRLAEQKPQIQATGPIKLAAEIRPASSFQTPSLYLRQTLKVNSAYLIPLPLLPRPKEIDSPIPQHKIQPANVYTPVDVLAIDPQGTIIQIWPQLLLSNLAAPVRLPATSHAVLYLSSGRAEQLGITPLDRVEHDMFTPPPESLQ